MAASDRLRTSGRTAIVEGPIDEKRRVFEELARRVRNEPARAPRAPTRLSVEVGVTYLAQPNEVKAVVLTALRDATLVLPSPAPNVVPYRANRSA